MINNNNNNNNKNNNNNVIVDAYGKKSKNKELFEVRKEKKSGTKKREEIKEKEERKGFEEMEGSRRFQKLGNVKIEK